MKLEPPASVDKCAHAVIGAAIEVHRHLGPGFLEPTYEEALALELKARGIEHQRQVPISIPYKGHIVGEARLDLLVEECLVVELKSVEKPHPRFAAQVISYLRASGCPLGLLINFNVRLLREGVQRIVLDPENLAATRGRLERPSISEHGALGGLAANPSGDTET